MHKLYSQLASLQKALIDGCTPQVLELIDKIPAYPKVPFVIGDYGAADGGNSFPLLDKIIGCVKKKRTDDYEISIIYEDQLNNDFNILFQKLNENLPNHPNLAQKYKNIYHSATSESFFNQCVPRNTISLAICFSSLHWIPRSSIPPGCPRKRLMPVNSTVVTETAANCWREFLLSRSKELIPGGYAFLGIFCVHEKKMEDVGTKVYGYMSVIEESWFSLFKEGSITKEEQEKLYISSYLHTEQEIRAPFKDQIGVMQGDIHLKLVSLEIEDVSHSYHEEKNVGIGEINPAARKMTDFIKSFSYGSVISSLSTLRQDDEKTKIADRLYHLIHEYYVNRPEQCVINVTYARVIVMKERPSL